MTDTNAPLVIIGSGLAGYNLAKEVRKLAPDQPIMMITADDGANYSKPMLSTGFGKDKSAQQLAMASAADMAEQLNLVIRTHTRVTHIDSDRKNVFIGEEPVPYSKLVLAWGAEVVPPRFDGADSERVLAINDLDDYTRFRQALQGKRKVLIMGAGLIGCEFANDLSNGGIEAEVVAPCDQVLPGLLPAAAAKAVQQGLESLGVRFHLGPLVSRIEESAAGIRATLSNGEQVDADLVLSAIGLKPRIDLAVKAGLKVNRGICVDRQLQTSEPDIYALGDCAEIDGQVLLYVLPLMTSARALAKTLTGNATEVSFGPMPVTIKTPVVPVVVSPPKPELDGEWQIEVDGSAVRAEFRAPNGDLLGYALTGDKVSNKVALNKELPPLLP